MALIHVSQKELCALSGLKPAEVEETLTALGIPLEAKDADDLSLEITPNRPDWLSVEGVARSGYSWRTGKPKTYGAAKSGISWRIDPSVREVRPLLGSAIARGVQMSESLLVSLMQVQEKLHDTLGRGRRRMAIGIHDLSSVRPPFLYRAVDRDEVRFTPLGKSSPMTPGQILMEHEKGIAYAHLVAGRCPLITDSNGEVLSFPPIINSARTRLGPGSRDLVIDCTGWHEPTVRVTVNILCAALSDRGAQIEEVKIDGAPYPLFEPSVWKLPVQPASKLLGVKLTAGECARHLRRLGHGAAGRSVRSPAYRADLMHEVDLIEDIAISIGLNNLPMRLPDFASAGQLASDSSALHEAMLGLGYFEVMSWILTSQHTLARSEAGLSSALRVKNPLTEEFTTLRPWLYPNLLDIFARSKSESLPQMLYEIGAVEAPVAGEKFAEEEHLAAAALHPKVCFSETYSNLQGLLSARGRAIALSPADLSGFIPGRAARILHGAETVGRIGEIHPEVLGRFGIEQPVALFEIQTAFLRN